MKEIKNRYRVIKDSVDTKTGKIIEKVFYYIVIITTFLFIPIFFTLFSTLAGANIISLSVYHGIFYTTGTLLILCFIVWCFFREYKYKD